MSRFSILGFVLLVTFLSGCVSAPPLSPWEKAPKDPSVVERRIPLLGSEFIVRIWSKGVPAQKLNQAFDAATKELTRVAQMADDQNPQSEITRVNGRASGGPVQISADLLEILVVSQNMWTRSGGAFDVTFAPIQEATEAHGPDAGLIGDQEHFMGNVRSEVKNTVGNRNLILDLNRATVQFAKPRMKLGIKGLAKGYAIHRAAESLRMFQLPGFAVIGGGVFTASGQALRSRALMCIENPKEFGTCLYRVVPPPNVVLFTMGRAASYDRPGHMYDPRTGQRQAKFDAVTVVAPDATWAQGAAVSASILDPSQLRGFLARQETPRIAGVFFIDPESEEDPKLEGSLAPYAAVQKLPPQLQK